MTITSGTTPTNASNLGVVVVHADPYGPNPLVTEVSARNPALFELASERGPAPTLFASGDLPPFTASGVDPEILTRIPFGMRHAAASEPDAGRVLALVEECANDRGRMGRGALDHPGMDDYRIRVQAWTDGIKQPDVAFEDADYPDSWRTPRMRAAAEQATS